MAFNGAGVFLINSTGQPVVYNTVIDETVFNALTADLATGLTTCLTKDGQSTPTANITMGGFKLTSVAAATTTGDALSYGRAANVTTLTATGALTYGGVTLTNSVTGTGKMVLDTSPTLVTPVLGVAAATSINFGGTALSHYDEGTWTPTDQSGAGLTFTVNHAVYRRIGNVVTVQAEITYPVTADVSSAVIGGLPFAVPSHGRGTCWALVSSSFAILISGSSNFSVNQVNGVAQSNANLSTGTVVFDITYSVT